MQQQNHRLNRLKDGGSEMIASERVLLMSNVVVDAGDSNQMVPSLNHHRMHHPSAIDNDNHDNLITKESIGATL